MGAGLLAGRTSFKAFEVSGENSNSDIDRAKLSAEQFFFAHSRKIAVSAVSPFCTMAASA